MKKSTIIVPALLAATSMGAFAGNFYIGSTAVLQTITARDSNYFGIHPTFSIGYGKMSDKYYLSGEIFAVPFAGTIATSISHFGVNTKTTYGFGASIIPGYRFKNLMTGFLRFGVINSYFPGLKGTRNGLQAGFGVLSPLTPKWDLRAEYIYTGYHYAPGLNSAKSNEVGLGVIYKFGKV